MKLISELAVTSIVAIHDLNHAAMFCDALIVMQNGNVIARGTPEQVLTESLLWQVFQVETRIEVSPYHGKNISTLFRNSRSFHVFAFLRPMTQIWPPVLLGSQFVFNIGFMRLCPFSSVPARRYAVIRRRHRTGAWVAHFSQQGMFIVGGALSDRFGARIVILWGCFIRIAGFLLLALGHSLWPIVLGACLTGVGGALFSPLLKRCSLKRASKARLAVNAAAPNGSLFCRMRRTGRGIRPGIGALFAGLGFRLVAFAGAAVFTGADRALFSLPPTQKNPLPCGPFPGGPHCASRGLSRLLLRTAPGY